MPFIRTILGDIDPDQLGRCYAHEHVVIDASFTTSTYPDFLLNDSTRIIKELKRFRAAGGQSMIDSMPCDCGRNAALQAEVSKASGVHIVVPTGLHLAKYYDPGHWSHRYTLEQLVELFRADIETGIDRHDYSGPFVDRLDNRAGLIKIATDVSISDRDRRIFEAAAVTHTSTGAPILTHTEQGKLGLEQVQMLGQLGVDLTKVTLSHLDRTPDPAYHREILSSGVNVEYDSAFRWKTPDNPTLRLIQALFSDFPGQIMLGMDAARNAYWKSYDGTPGLTYLLDEFCPALRAAGFNRDEEDRIFIANPARAYAFRVP